MKRRIRSIIKSRPVTAACSRCRSGMTRCVPLRRQGWASVHKCENCGCLFDGGQRIAA